jgi:hypothetical protein
MKITYTRKELQELKAASIDRYQEVVQTLMNKLANKQELSLAESRFICLGLRNTYSDDPNAPKIEAENFVQCADFMFLSKYLLYWADHEGWGQINNFGEIMPVEQKKKDVEFLDEHYKDWKAIIYAKKHSSELLQYLAVETIRLINEVVSYSKQIGDGSNRLRHIEKSLILFSKYVYYQVKEYYQELGKVEEMIELCGNLIVINQFAYVHILLGHFAKDIKYNRTDKSYHRSNIVDFKNIPTAIIEILNLYKSEIDCKYFDSQKIFFTLNNQDYVIWFRQMKRFLLGNVEEVYLRVQTFYPVELQEDITKIKGMLSIKANENIAFYVS